MSPSLLIILRDLGSFIARAFELSGSIEASLPLLDISTGIPGGGVLSEEIEFRDGNGIDGGMFLAFCH